MRIDESEVWVEDGVVSLGYSADSSISEFEALETIQEWSGAGALAVDVGRVVLFRTLSSIDGPIRLIVTDEEEWFAEGAPDGPRWDGTVTVGDRDAVIRCSSDGVAYTLEGSAGHRLNIVASTSDGAEPACLALLIRFR